MNTSNTLDILNSLMTDNSESIRNNSKMDLNISTELNHNRNMNSHNLQIPSILENDDVNVHECTTKDIIIADNKNLIKEDNLLSIKRKQNFNNGCLQNKRIMSTEDNITLSDIKCSMCPSCHCFQSSLSCINHTCLFCCMSSSCSYHMEKLKSNTISYIHDNRYINHPELLKIEHPDCFPSIFKYVPKHSLSLKQITDTSSTSIQQSNVSSTIQSNISSTIQSNNSSTIQSNNSSTIQSNNSHDSIDIKNESIYSQELNPNNEKTNISQSITTQISSISNINDSKQQDIQNDIVISESTPNSLDIYENKSTSDNLINNYSQLFTKYQTLISTTKRKTIASNLFVEKEFKYIGDTITIFSIHEYFGSDYSLNMRRYIKHNYKSIQYHHVNKLNQWNKVLTTLLNKQC